MAGSRTSDEPDWPCPDPGTGPAGDGARRFAPVTCPACRLTQPVLQDCVFVACPCGAAFEPGEQTRRAVDLSGYLCDRVVVPPAGDLPPAARARLLEITRGTGTLATPLRRGLVLAWAVTGAAGALALAAVVLVALYLGMDADLRVRNRVNGGVILLSLALPGSALALLVAAVWFSDRVAAARRRTAREVVAGAAVSTRPVLYLRAFSDDRPLTGPDGVYARAGGGMSFEEMIAGEFAAVGPVLAVGRPGELGPPPGAARLWVPDHGWREAVEFLVAESALVVMVMGDMDRHPGLAWEAQRALRPDALRKLVLVVPPLSFGDVLRRWTCYATLAGDVFPPPTLLARYVYFDTAGRPRIVAHETAAGYVAESHASLGYRGRVAISSRAE